MADVMMISRQITPFLVPGLFLLLLLLETLSPLRRRKRRRGPRYVVNAALTGLGFITGVLTVRPVALAGATWAQTHSFGLLHLGALPLWVQVAAGVVLMDLTFYYWHRLNHTRPLLWRFHNVHHDDPDMDVTTSFRFHWGEVLYSTAFRLLQVGLIGVLPLTYVAYEVVFNAATMFHHSNLRLPVAWERRLNLIFVTPRMHGVHHSVIGRETNSNYSVIFSWWDRLNRSLRLNIRQTDIIIGVPGYLAPRDNRVLPMLAQPFRRPRPYWRWPSGRAVVRPPAGEPPLNPKVMAD
ncbi:MAG: sterol desaturase family protein [Syntrophobacterales bacterium]|jgi:sterol desaturase/sphingolipid hydroxylase (fatty acid hydroxylase superfamily)|nr:sterol desaturase family protein [Syntrophobacterales bacterium]